jgi:hypothetical protein
MPITSSPGTFPPRGFTQQGQLVLLGPARHARKQKRCLAVRKGRAWCVYPSFPPLSLPALRVCYHVSADAVDHPMFYVCAFDIFKSA